MHRQSSQRDGLYLEESDDTLNPDALHLDTLNTHTPSETSISTTQGVGFRFDPSMYKFQDSLRATCIDSANTVQRMNSGYDLNTIYLPTGRVLTYNNTQDVLHLRFVPQAFRLAGDGRHASPISALFESIWSEALASTLHYARRVAIDVSQLWPDLTEGQSEVLQDVAFLACVLQNDLEVLYLVDYCAGRCNGGAKVGGLRSSEWKLYRKLYGYGSCGGSDPRKDCWDKERRRHPDIFHGVGKIWREVFGLEEMGWDEEHPGLAFAEAFSEVVRLQQDNCIGDVDERTVKKKLKFKGVRVLIAEDEEIDGTSREALGELNI
ncbi:hypothetical protein VP1G_11457 [Cytospora mali]|uniref:Uncharacterized protein n=1 Tax=Cytospora mali TaxID=578113 RepID=A0A194VFL8_CYTMA|nr:hypothetical protein VP1G_11457 [Valsa mali var. pyri (nom. inval.)]